MHLNQTCQAKTPGRSIPDLSLHKAVYARIMLCLIYLEMICSIPACNSNSPEYRYEC